jgi:hypothetical protein
MYRFCCRLENRVELSAVTSPLRAAITPATLISETKSVRAIACLTQIAIDTQLSLATEDETPHPGRESKVRRGKHGGQARRDSHAAAREPSFLPC